jgi:hypothetical protein
MERHIVPTAKRLPPLRCLAIAVGISLGCAATHAFGVSSAHAQERRAEPTELSQRYDAAVRDLMMQRYGAAFDRFAALADRGHPSSALMALALLRYRPTMAGSQWTATPAQVRHWAVLAAYEERANGRLFAAYNEGE